jgi:hypothetical protein
MTPVRKAAADLPVTTVLHFPATALPPGRCMPAETGMDGRFYPIPGQFVANLITSLSSEIPLRTNRLCV